jgi:hypothetical protein
MEIRKLITTPLSPPSQGGDEGVVRLRAFNVHPSQGGDFVVMVRQAHHKRRCILNLSKDQSNDEGEVFHF